MPFNPTTRDLETIATLAHARVPTATIAAVLGLEVEDFRRWLSRMSTAKVRGDVEPEEQEEVDSQVNPHIVRGIF